MFKRTEKFEYNHNSQVSKKTVVEEDGTKTHTTTEEYKYDGNGQLVERTIVEEEK